MLASFQKRNACGCTYRLQRMLQCMFYNEPSVPPQHPAPKTWPTAANRRDSAYLEADHDTAWLKIKNRSYSQAVDRHELFDSQKFRLPAARWS